MSNANVSAAASQPGWLDALRAHARSHAFAAWGLGLSALALLALLLQSLAQILAGEASAVLRFALIGGTAGFAATALGALPALRGASTQRMPEVEGQPDWLRSRAVYSHGLVFR